MIEPGGEVFSHGEHLELQLASVVESVVGSNHPCEGYLTFTRESKVASLRYVESDITEIIVRDYAKLTDDPRHVWWRITYPDRAEKGGNITTEEIEASIGVIDTQLTYKKVLLEKYIIETLHDLLQDSTSTSFDVFADLSSKGLKYLNRFEDPTLSDITRDALRTGKAVASAAIREVSDDGVGRYSRRQFLRACTYCKHSPYFFMEEQTMKYKN